MDLRKYLDDDKIAKSVLIVIEGIILFNIVTSLLAQNWRVFFVSLGLGLFVLVPYVIRKKTNYPVPPEIEIFLILFAYASVYLGSLQNYYEIYWWWDKVLHFLSGIALALIGFITLHVFYGLKKLKATSLLLAFLSFIFAVALGGLWEIAEFTIDQTFGTEMQPSLFDTNMDLIMDSAGALVASIFIYIYMKTGFLPIEKIVQDSKKDNK